MCRRSNGVAICQCQPGYVGVPPTCRPECVVSSQCALNRACVNQKCVDPCPGTCGTNARCQVVNHAPICSCNPGFTGDPFTRCLRPDSKLCFSHCECVTQLRISNIVVVNAAEPLLYDLWNSFLHSPTKYYLLWSNQFALDFFIIYCLIAS